VPGNIWQIYREHLAIGGALEDRHISTGVQADKARRTSMKNAVSAFWHIPDILASPGR
jgi:hypothetical protein